MTVEGLNNPKIGRLPITFITSLRRDMKGAIAAQFKLKKAPYSQFQAVLGARMPLNC